MGKPIHSQSASGSSIEALEGAGDINARVLVIIPAYNEAASISQVIQGVRDSAPFADIVVVNDGSSDDTALVAKLDGANIISHCFNMGYGIALQTGFKYALARGYAYVIYLDGDGQHESKCIRDILAELLSRSADVVIGSRYLGNFQYRTDWTRRLASILFGCITSKIIGQRITDPTSGFRGCNRLALKFYVQDVFPVDFPDADVLIMLHFAGLSIKEVPVTMYHKASGKSMHSGIIKPLYYVYKMLLAIIMVLLRDIRKLKGG